VEGLQWALRSDRRELVLVHSMVVGRGVGVDIQLEDDSVSRRHAVFRLTENGPVVEDLDSRNGTRVNGRPISSPALLALGDRVALGDTEFELVNAADVRDDRVTQPMTNLGSDHAASETSLAALSPRERAVFPLLARGLSQREIAAQCGVSVKTVETYRTRISHKLGLHSRAELIRFALETGVLRPRARN
jgi:pSer/pThr/pTyr-binding forkhead associated (FHA) protein